MKESTYRSFYHLLFDQARFGIVILNFNGEFLDVNPFICSLLGYTRKELLKLAFLNLIHPGDLVIEPFDTDPVVNGNTIVKERRLLKKDGEVITAEIHSQKLEKDRILVLIHDISGHEKAKQASEEKYRQIVETALEGFWQMDENSTTTFVNKRMTEILGYDKSEMIGKGVDSFFMAEEIPDHAVIMKERREGRGGIYERRFRRKDGSICWAKVAATPTQDENGVFSGSFALITDITKIKHTEFALRAGEEKYRQIADKTSDVIWMMNEKMEYTYVSPSIFRQRGFTPEEFLNLKPEEIYPPESRKKAIDVYAYGLQLVKEGKLPPNYSLTIELQHYCKDGSLKDSEVIISPIIDAQGNLKGGHGVSRDISERMKTGRALKESEERFRLAFQTSPDSINIHNMETGEYVEVNDGFTKLTGYTRDEVMGKTSFTTNIWGNFEDRARLIELLKRDGAVSNFETTFRFKDGTVHTGLLSASIILLNGIRHIISIVRDIEELKKAERDIVKAMESAEEASRLKTAFLNNISHEVRTPMNAILGFTELIQAENVIGPERDRFFGIITSNAKQLLSIIDDVLEISRMDSGRIPFHPGTFSLHEMMKDIHLSMNEMVVRKGLDFFYSHDDMGGTDYVITDREKVRQIITGLIDNSIKFTLKGNISFGYVKRLNEIEFFIRDSGIGIHENEIEKIFERFYQVGDVNSEGVRGAGLGLSIARGLAEVMGGTIRVESSPGSGSVFYLSVPYKETVMPPVQEETKKQFSMEDLTILVAEDEDYNYELLHVLLSKKTKLLLHAKNGAEVISLLEKQKPDIILMDLKMPVMNGYEATRKARSMFPDLRIIALTAYTQPEEERLAIEAGCCAFITKPIKKQDLIETIRRSLRN